MLSINTYFFTRTLLRDKKIREEKSNRRRNKEVKETQQLLQLAFSYDYETVHNNDNML